MQTKSRKSFIDKNLESEIHPNEKLILFTLNQEPERSTIIATPYYTNQIEEKKSCSRTYFDRKSQ